MCGRFTLKAKPKEVQDELGLPFEPQIQPRYNIAPTQTILAIRANAGGKPEAVFLRWGLVPSWADELSIASRMINARSETIREKPSFRSAFKRRRCLIPADGFYEWQKLDKKRKQPFWIHRPDQKPFVFAGLWEHRERPGEDPLETCTILTTGANTLVKPMHDRMPVIFGRREFETWLDPESTADELISLLQPCPDDFLEATAVSDRVNSPKHEDAGCIVPVAGDNLFA